MQNELITFSLKSNVRNNDAKSNISCVIDAQ